MPGRFYPGSVYESFNTFSNDRSQRDKNEADIEETKHRIPLLDAQAKKAGAEATEKEFNNQLDATMLNDFRGAAQEMGQPDAITESVIRKATDPRDPDQPKAERLVRNGAAALDKLRAGQEERRRVATPPAAGQFEAPKPPSVDVSKPSPFHGTEAEAPTAAPTGPGSAPLRTAGGYEDPFGDKTSPITQRGLDALAANPISDNPFTGGFDRGAAAAYKGRMTPGQLFALETRSMFENARKGELAQNTQRWAAMPGVVGEAAVKPYGDLAAARHNEVGASKMYGDRLTEDVERPYKADYIQSQTAHNLASAEHLRAGGGRGGSGGSGKPMTPSQRDAAIRSWETRASVAQKGMEKAQAEMSKLKVDRGTIVMLGDESASVEDRLRMARAAFKGLPNNARLEELADQITSWKEMKSRALETAKSLRGMSGATPEPTSPSTTTRGMVPAASGPTKVDLDSLMKMFPDQKPQNDGGCDGSLGCILRKKYGLSR